MIQTLLERGLVPLQYAQENPNGSMQSIAGVCDPTGRILGMMAHPEAATFFTQHPHWIRRKEELKREQKPLPVYGEGLALFKNAIHHLEGLS
jgi:phosphoribosylformylglycinamidine synthase